MSRWTGLMAGFAAVALGAVAWAAQPAVYPAKGQSADQQKKDDGECKTWAKGNTGIDPAALAAAPAPAPPPPGAGGQRARGAAKGAVIGGAIGDSDDAKTGAVVGAAAGGAKARQQKQAQAQQQQQAAAQQQQQMATFQKAWGACMEGRGYSVK